MSINPQQKLEYLYKEYTRLSDIAEDHIKSTYDDIKLMGAIGAAVLIWKPISDFIVTAHTAFDSNLVLLLGFLGIETILGILASFNLIKHANSWYFVHNLQSYELRIKQLLEEADGSQVFAFYQGKEKSKYITATYKTAFLLFAFSVRFSAAMFPFLILCSANVAYALIFLSYAVVDAVVHLLAAKRVFRQYSNKTFLGLM
ncbi:MAG: hypothetical protein F6J95_009045 [Leptolyngbya sp. SIO1E4]|nr:hypothetical protein [Leptolyngbya sp. SIO1E4]